MKKYSKIILIYLVALLIGSVFIYILFMPIFCAKSLIFPYAIHPFDICKEYPKIWQLIKKLYLITFLISYSIILIKIIRKFKFKFIKEKDTNIIDDYELNNEINLIVQDSVKTAIKDRIEIINRLLNLEKLSFIDGQTRTIIEALQTALFDEKAKDDRWIDDGETSDIDSLDSFVYSFEYWFEEISYYLRKVA